MQYVAFIVRLQDYRKELNCIIVHEKKPFATHVDHITITKNNEIDMHH